MSSALNPRQAETLERLFDAGRDVLADLGPADLTVRVVAQRAGVSPATAYTYLASKNQLFAELYVRHLLRHPAPATEGTPTERLQAVARHHMTSLEGHRHLAAAAYIALLSADPGVEDARRRVGEDFAARFAAAGGGSLPAAQVDALVFAFSGALLQVGMGLLDPAELPDRFDAVVALVVRGAEGAA